jgi:hypothetical protein
MAKSNYNNSNKRKDHYSDVLISKKRNTEADINEVFYSREYGCVCFKRGVNDIIPFSSALEAVQSVTGLDTDNTDPLNPVVKVAVDPMSIVGEGTPQNPLRSLAFVQGLFGLYSQTDTSGLVTGTAGGSLVGTGIGGLSVPANGFKVGDSFHAKIGGHISNANNETLHIEVKAGSVILANTGTMTIGATNNDFWEIEIDFTIRSLGGPGVASIISNGQFVYVRSSNLDYKGVGFNSEENTFFDTTVPNTLDLTAHWGSNNAANHIASDSFVLFKTFSGI